MTVQKRSIVTYIILNCLSLGIYGFIVGNQINSEVNALCKGDGQEPKSYMAAVIFRGIPAAAGMFVGLLLALFEVGGTFSFFMDESLKVITVFMYMATYAISFTLLGSVISGIYSNYWWYKQANRLKLNANRYGLDIKEKGSDLFVFRTVANLLFVPVTLILFGLALIAPTILIWLISLAENETALVFCVILLYIVSIPLCLFGSELTVGANFSAFFMFKNLNRFADVYRKGAAPFDPMAYEYYPSVNNKYPNFLPNMVNGVAIAAKEEEKVEEDFSTNFLAIGSLVGLTGSCAGYNFDLTSGEEIIVGKDAKVASVVIDPAYKEVSRKHFSVSYDILCDQYRVVDYSSNGTIANGNKLIPGQEVYLPHGTEISLATGKNTFRLD